LQSHESRRDGWKPNPRGVRIESIRPPPRAGFNRPFGTYATATLPGIEMPGYYHLVPPGQKLESRPDMRDFCSPAYLAA